MPIADGIHTLYDPLGRISEVGELVRNFPITATIAADPASLRTWIVLAGSTRYQVTKTYYDNPVFAPSLPVTQINLRNRVVSATYKETYDTNSPFSYDYATHYTYDMHGNVYKLVQDIYELSNIGQEFKIIDYDYDLISGKVNKVSYQKGFADQFFHRYEYDADNRITDVKTSTNGLVWTADARYFYYDHGPLKRTELGGFNVQGLDYIYTIQGWIKALNSDHLNPAHDPGVDGTNNGFGTDAFGYVINYFNGDYRGIGGNNNFEVSKTNSNFENNSHNLYNGNIKQVTTAMMAPCGEKLSELGTNYYYDQLNRIMKSEVYFGNNFYSQSSPSWVNISASTDYYTSYSYDPNGNINRLVRNGNTASGNVSMDNLVYHYLSGMNKLLQVEDDVASGNYLNDIDNQSSSTNYAYDETGNLTSDASEGLTNTWNVYGKLKEVQKTNGTTIDFAYDATGNRIVKAVTINNITVKDYYVRDAQGNVMAMYELKSDTFWLTEHDLYGSSRLGIKQTRIPINVSSYDSTRLTELLGYKQYELTNHLGNVQVTLSDRLIPHLSGPDSIIDFFSTDVRSAVDYYPFGMELPGRVYALEIVPHDSSILRGSFAVAVPQPNPTSNVMVLNFLLNGTTGVFDLHIVFDLSAFTGDLLVTVRDGNGQIVYYYQLDNSMYPAEVNALGIHITTQTYTITIEPLYGSSGQYGINSPPMVYEYDVVTTLLCGGSGEINYRFGFNGQEKDNEIYGEGNLNTAKFWEYDSRLGRRWNLDPDPNYNISFYACFTLNPINNIDILGNIVEHASSRDKFNTTLKRILSKDFRRDYRELKQSTEIYRFEGSTENSKTDKGGEFAYEGGNKLLIKYHYGFDKSLGIGGLSKLAHETKHGVQFNEGYFGFQNDHNGNGWYLANNDIYEEYGAWNATMQGSGRNNFKDYHGPSPSDGYDLVATDYSTWNNSNFSEKINFLKGRYSKDRTDAMIVNGNDKRIKDGSNYFLPYKENRVKPIQSVPIIKISPIIKPVPVEIPEQQNHFKW